MATATTATTYERTIAFRYVGGTNYGVCQSMRGACRSISERIKQAPGKWLAFRLTACKGGKPFFYQGHRAWDAYERGETLETDFRPYLEKLAPFLPADSALNIVRAYTAHHKKTCWIVDHYEIEAI